MKRARAPLGALALCLAAGCQGAAAQPDEADFSLPKKPEAPVGAAPAVLPAARYGLIADSTLTLLFRNYAEYLGITGAPHRNAWVQSVRAMFTSGYTDGPLGVGLDLAPYAAIKLDGGRGTRNMVRVGPDDSRAGDTGWAYLGSYAVKARVAGVVIKYGLQSIANPFLDPYDIRALPPSFRGVSWASNPTPTLALSGGSIDSMIVRGATYRQPLATGYGGTSFSRMDWVGADWNYSPQGKLALYANQARAVWNQLYLSGAHSFDGAGMKWSAGADLYVTHDQGRQLQGPINNQAYSLSLTAARGPHSLMAGYQQVAGDQFFDFLQETSGIYLSNAMGADYNAPHERSVQLRYKLDGAAFGVKGLQTMLWGIAGWGADGRTDAARYADPQHPLYSLYWRNGQPIDGAHRELGVKLTHASSAYQGVKVSLLVIAHNISHNYPSKTFRDVRLIADIPFKLY